MRRFDRTWLKASAADRMKRLAAEGTWDGRGNSPYFIRCRAYHESSGTVMLLTRDVGYHTSGWWKNPDYERCYHLSLSFRDPATHEQIPKDKALTREWLGLFFGKDASKLWCEPPYSPEAKKIDVWHYRLFCAPNWTPIVPRGEVYGRELTEAGWLSYSDVQAAAAAEAEQARERAS